MPNEIIDSQFDSLLPPLKVNRRGFLVTSSAAIGYALATGPVQAQTAIKTPADGLDIADIKVPTSDGREMPAYVAAPAARRRNATIIVVPEVFGMHEYQRDICRRLAKAGYTALSLDPFFRMGDLSKMPDVKEVVGNANKLQDSVMLADLDSLVATIEKHPKANAAKLGITGMCRGGRTVWMYSAHSKKIKAGVSWFGGIQPVGGGTDTPITVAPRLNAPVLGLYGGADAGIPNHMVAQMQNALETGTPASKASRFILYPNMPHAFHADYRPSYRKEAADDGWQRMLEWFRQHGVA